MKCLRCGSENREGVKFCGDCGAKFLISCPRCNAENPPENKFCNECGQAVSTSMKPPPKELTFDEKLFKIQRYLPQGLTEKILSQRDRIEGERKQVTVLFTDMAGYTPLTEKLDPEETYSLMDEVYEILIHKVADYGGTVNELTGDGVMALFGAPIALEDAPQRAIRASLAIHREMVQFNDRMRREKPGLPPLRMRAGIHTGPVVVGTVGNDLRVEFKAVGDTVNLASRMEGLAEPGATYVSEAGMGKSRLLYEFRKAVLNEDITFLEGKCLSFGRGVAYQPISDILKSNFYIREGDGDSVIRNKVTLGLQVICVDEGPAMPYLLELLSVKDSGIEKIQLSPEGKKDRTIETLKKILVKGSELRPLVIAIEDLLWIDKTSEDVLKYILESIPGARVLLIFTYRTEFVPTWGARSYHNQINLNCLSNRESLVMVTHLLGTDYLESALEEVILEKTAGIPFFIEEFIKSLKDLRFIERKDSTYRIAKKLQAIGIPSTSQDVIMARVDALPERAKEVLQVGSLIEREFGYQLLKEVMYQQEGVWLSKYRT